MKKFLAFALIFFLAGSAPAQVAGLPPLPQGPLLLTSCRPEHFSPDYWINKLPEPDKVLLTPAQLKVFNEDIHAMIRTQYDVFKLGSSRPGKPVKAQIQLEYKTLRGRVLYDTAGARVPKSIFDDRIAAVAGIEKVPATIKLRYAAAARQTAVRALPIDMKMLEEVGDVEFDMLQFTQIKLWTPVAILHTSTDGAWHYIQAPYTRGWVKARDLAMFDSVEQLRKYVKGPFLTVTGESLAVFTDPALQNASQRASMGTFLPIAEKRAGGAYVVWLPERGKGGKVAFRKAFISGRSDSHEGFLLYTQANVIRQAFKLLGARYGWGGMYNGRDCSGFTHDVFLPFGIDMPRGSKEQGFVGTQLGHFEYKQMGGDKYDVLMGARAGITLLRMPKHQMLYLGEENGQFYVIHCTWAERVSMSSDEKNRINQVVVSDLNLNGRSYLGSLYDRIISMNELH